MNVLFIFCNLGESSSKEAEYWLRTLRATYSLSFRYLLGHHYITT